MKLLIVLAPCGSLLIYSGPNMIAKVHVGGILSTRQPTPVNLLPTATLTIPRRSSLLPTVQSNESTFDDDMHLLSPVYPLQQPQFGSRPTSYCCGLRDPAGNRFTLVYPNNSMYRVSIPFLSECPLVTRCLVVLRQVLSKELSFLVIAKWYGVRNAPGSQDLCSTREWTYFKDVLLQLLGRPNKISSSQSNSSSLSASSSNEPKKRRKTDNCVGSDADFQFLQSHLSHWKRSVAIPRDDKEHVVSKSDASASLFAHTPTIFFAFHLLYEEMKLDTELRGKMKFMAEFLNQMAVDLGLDAYRLHYFGDFPELIDTRVSCVVADTDRSKLLNTKLVATSKVANIFQTIDEWINERNGKRSSIELYPIIGNVNPISKHVIELVSLISMQNHYTSTFQINVAQSAELQDNLGRHAEKISDNLNEADVSHEVLMKIRQIKMTRKDIHRLPPAVRLLISEELEKRRADPPIDCGPEVYQLLLRPELFSNTMHETEKENITYNNFKNENSLSPKIQASNSHPDSDSNNVALNNDGMTHIHTKLLRLRFPQDLRVDEVRRLLASANPVVIDITQKIGVSDHEFIEEKEKQLLGMCTRTMSLPVGRGMFTMRTSTPAATESLPIPKLCLTGKEREKGVAIELQQIELPQNMSMWPLFHNGVAAGLQLTPDCKDIDSTWIVYNKPKVSNDSSTEHAGFLMALGLNGHLKTLSFMSIYDYLSKCDEMTSLGLIVGISAAHRGSMDATTTKLLSVHIEALLPATALELDIPQNIQIAAIMGIGLLYQGTAKRHIAEVLLQEIGRPPGPEMENCVERESYALAAGLALGLVTLGKGESQPGLKDLQLPDTLHYYMVGGNRRPLTGAQKEKYKLPSFQVREGDTVNIDVTAPGAILALGLMFFGTGNKAVAGWMNPPDTTYLLDLVRPDLLLLQIIARGLILWDEIEPTAAWLNAQFPKSLAARINLKNSPDDLETSNIDHEALW